MTDTKENTKLWDSVCETDPSTTKEVNQKGGFTAICAQGQFKRATELWGPYGGKWGIKDCKYGYEHTNTDNGNDAIAEVWVEATFYYPAGEFSISSDIAFRIGNDNRKKLLTDITTKALSKLGFNADVFEGKFDDNKYIAEMNHKFAAPAKLTQEQRELQLEAIDGLYNFDNLTDFDAYSPDVSSLPDVLRDTYNNQKDVVREQLVNGVVPECPGYRFIGVEHAVRWATSVPQTLKDISAQFEIEIWAGVNQRRIDALDTMLKSDKYLKNGKTPGERVQGKIDERKVAIEKGIAA